MYAYSISGNIQLLNMAEHFGTVLYRDILCCCIVSIVYLHSQIVPSVITAIEMNSLFFLSVHLYKQIRHCLWPLTYLLSDVSLCIPNTALTLLDRKGIQTITVLIPSPHSFFM